MSDKGGGGQQQQQPTQQTITQTNIPDYAAPYFQDALSRAQSIQSTPYQPYNSQLVANLAPNQQKAIDLAGQQAGQLPGQVGTSTNIASQAAQQALNAPNINLPTVQSGIFGLPQAQQYMSPYIQQSLDPALQQIQRQGDIRGQQIASNATGQHAFGGYREALQQAENQRNTGYMMADTEAQGLQQAYQNAQNQFNTANASQMQATQANAQNQLGLGQLGIQGAGVGTQAANTLANLGGLTSDIQTRDLGNLQQTGALQQGNQQQGLDAAYQQWQNAVNYPRQNLAYYSSIIRGMTPQVNQDVQTFQAPPNPYSQMAGLGVAGLGLSKLFTGNG